MNLHNIGVISHYEVKLLKRSWLFRIFTILALLGITMTILIQQTSVLNPWNEKWNSIALSSMMPFVCIYFYNIVQSIIVIFLSGSFLKRDKKMDTAEVIYVRPMSNADYIIGKTWGIIRVFMSLNIVVLLITGFLNVFVNHSPFSVFPYVFYLFTISFPSLLFVLGLSFTLTCLLKNQAVTLIVMLGLIGVTFFYLENTLNGVFDFFGVNIPSIFSDETGHANILLFLLQRSIYLLAGIGLISFTIALVKRLPHRPWKVIIVNIIGALFVLAGCCAGLLYVLHFKQIANLREQYVEVYKTYEPAEKVHILTHEITMEQQGRKLNAESVMKIHNNQDSTLSRIIFYLNPSLKVSSVEYNGSPLAFEQNRQVIVVDKEIQPEEELSFTMKYSGNIDENICYIDIEKEQFFDTKVPGQYFRFGKRYAWLEDTYTLLTPESMWYPMSIPPSNPESPYRIGKNFTQYTLTVRNPGNKTVLSQGKSNEEEGQVTFTNKIQLTGISVAMGNYEKKSLSVDSMDYEIYYFEGHDFFSKYFSEIGDTLPSLIKEKMNDIERGNGRDYPFSKFVMAETPVQFATHTRNWKGYSEYVQPEIIFMPERLAINSSCDFEYMKYVMKYWTRNGEEPDSLQKEMECFDWFLWNSIRSATGREGNDWNNQVVNKFFINPLFFGYMNFIRSEEYPIFDITFNTMPNVSTPMRSWQTIDDRQRANLYLENKSFKMATEDVNIKPEIFYELLKLKSNILKNYIYSLIPEEEFNKFLKEFSSTNYFREVSFEQLSEAIADEFDIDISSFVEKWYTEDHSPVLFVRDIDANQVIINDITCYQVKFKINNPSNVDAIITTQVMGGGGGRRGGGRGNNNNTPSNYVIPANTAQEVKIIMDNRPAGLAINTNISRNLPTLHNYNFSKITTTTKDTMAGVFPIDTSAFAPNPNEIIIDNEDPGFRTIDANSRHKLSDFFKKEDQDKYTNFYPWMVPSKWGAIAGDYCYGETINSAVCKKKGNGSNSVEWSANIPQNNYYEVSVWNAESPMERWVYYGGGRHRRVERIQTYTIKYGNKQEDIPIDMEQEDGGWVSLGYFDLPKGTTTITLTDKVGGSKYYVIADAVRFTVSTKKEK